ncbi:MBL fold metallo-hydrolase [Deinococcus multiflagellatus]|uniref:MBL fold metallo-hydrolase n=1 Tax=Deinococcus multiflagellatus TaxID=1656887 RepID=A0ABW1ZRJ6_9DEIO|nr:MBL fold metallo-hydrolase [Deinococcus multiflagellatus]MBZ9715015.1 MBL fold metallo-hydrolase [Deinococcus multiflagellatus]
MSSIPSAVGQPSWLRPDVAQVRLPLVNVFFLGRPGEDWVLVDAGLPGTAGLIRKAAQAAHGGRPPRAIVLTHGHLDHVGALRALLRQWPAPVYVHALERPFVTGEARYPWPDPLVGGGMSLLSPAFVPGPFDFGPAVQTLPAGGDIPGLDGWRWLHTPGHSDGHISLWRAADHTLIAGDAVVTTHQATVRGALTLRPVSVQGPPTYYTPNWEAAHASVQTLADLGADLLATGHGHPVQGPHVSADLTRLARTFEERSRPSHGWYARRPVAVGGPVPPGLGPLGRPVAALGALAAAWWVTGRR